METKTERKRADFWRYGPEITEIDVMVFNACEYETCNLCDHERKGRCDAIRDVLKPPEEVFIHERNLSLC